MTVALGIIHGSSMDSHFVRSLYGLTRDRQDQVAGAIFVEGGAGRLDNARNEVAKRFLGTNADYLLTIDTDIVFSAKEFDLLTTYAETTQTPVLSGCYFVDERPPRAAFARVEDGSVKSVKDWNDGDVIDVDYCGAGFMLVQRSVLQALGDEPYRQDVTLPSGALGGEDYAFCSRSRDAGFDIKVHTGVFLGHSKRRVLGYE